MSRSLIWILPFMWMVASCSEQDGDWDSFKWDKKEYKNVSAEGGVFVSTLKNYKSCWLTSTSMDGVVYEGGSIYNNYDDEDSTGYTYNGVMHYHYKNPRLDVQIEGNKVTMTVAPNPDPVPHKFYVDLSMGDCFGPGISITQKAKE